jgi:hypothetical protein
MTIVDDNAAYEKWLGDWCDVVQADLDYKHDRMKLNPFAFLRATFFRWARVIPLALNEFAAAPGVLSVGDAHVENFGTWLDANGNEIWGVNDFDDAASIPYPFDLVRLATSAVLVPQTTSTEAQVSAAILEGYKAGLATPRPTVVTGAPDWMQAQLMPTRGDKHFWKGLLQKITTDTAPLDIQQMLLATLPVGFTNASFSSRRKGGGGLGRPRYLVVAELGGKPVAREAKAAVPSAWDWAHNAKNPGLQFMPLASGRYRSPDPLLNVVALSPNRQFIVRPVSPESHKIDIDQYANAALDPRLLSAMAFDLASIHAADPNALAVIQNDVKGQPDAWLEAATRIARKSVEDDFKVWTAT